MSTQRIFSLFTGGISILGIVGAMQLKLLKGNNLGPGAVPLIYACILLVLSTVFFITDKSEEKLTFKSFTKEPARNGVIFFFLNVLMLIMVYFIGAIPSIFVFSILALTILKSLDFKKTLVFSIFWAAALYVVFVVLLDVPLESGMLFELIGQR